MSLIINSETTKSIEHFFSDYMAFLDSDGDFWLIDEEGDYISRLTTSGCLCESIADYDTIEDFLRIRFNCKLVKAFAGIDEFKITIDC